MAVATPWMGFTKVLLAPRRDISEPQYPFQNDRHDILYVRLIGLPRRAATPAAVGGRAHVTLVGDVTITQLPSSAATLRIARVPKFAAQQKLYS